MSCRRCGCRMLTKVGRTNPLLICTDCGLPVDERQTATLSRQRLWGACTLLALAVLGAAMLLLASIKEMNRPEVLGGSAENRTETSGDDGGEDSRLMEPSSLLDGPSPSRADQPLGREPQTRGRQIQLSAGESEPGAGRAPAAAGPPQAPTPAAPGR